MSETVLRVLLEASMRATVVAALVGAALIALHVRAASVQHRAWTAVLFAMLLMPILPSAVPSIDVDWPRLVTTGPALRVLNFVARGANSKTISTSTGVDVNTREAVSTVKSGGEPTTMAINQEAGSVPGARANWTSVVVSAYAAGVLMSLVRLVAGLYFARRISTASRPVQHGVVESSSVFAPVIVGVLSPVIVLPVTWRDWPAVTLRMVLAHERAHIARRDPLIHFIAHINRCVFWFHPLAWWLPRALRSTAEYASDDIAVREVDDVGRYADVLIEMAAAVRAHRGRLLWHGLGMGGRGPLRVRIDRVLRGDAFTGLSRTRTITVTAACLFAIVLAAACRQATPPLPREIADLEASLRDDPDALVRVARALISATPSGRDSTNPDLDRLAQLYLERAMKLDPDPDFVGPHFLRLEIQARLRQKRSPVPATTPLVHRYAAVSALPELVRLDFLADSVISFNGFNDDAERWNDLNLKEYVQLSRELTRKSAEDLLKLAPKYRSHPRYGTAIYRANLALTALALKGGDTKAAVEHLREASRAPASEELVYGRGEGSSRLLRDLINAGEREPVAEFLDRMAAIRVGSRNDLRELAAAIRRGETPTFPRWVLL